MALRKFEVGKFYAYQMLWKDGSEPIWGDAEVVSRDDEQNTVTLKICGSSVSCATCKIEKQRHSEDEYVILATPNEFFYGILIQSKVPFDTREEAIAE